MGITYRKAPTELTFNVPDTPIQVLLDGRIVGLIRETAGGFAYYPKGVGSKGKGETFLTLDACKRSLEPDSEPNKKLATLTEDEDARWEDLFQHFIDRTDPDEPRQVGGTYPTKESLLLNVERYGSEFGCDGAKPRPIPPAEKIAWIAKFHLHIETLETRNSDRLDFHDLAVWSIKAALEAAYDAGRESAQP